MKKRILSIFCIIALIIPLIAPIFLGSVEAKDIEISNQFYYRQLTSDLSRSVYEGLLNDISATGKFRVDANLSYEVEGINLENQEEKLYELYENNIRGEIYDAFCAFILDHPEYYWVRYNCIDGTITPEINYNMESGTIKINGLDMELYILPESQNKSEFQTKLQEVANSITGEDDYEILQKIYNYIISNVSNTDLDGSEVQQTAYGALMNNKASDEGESNLFVLLCREKGINSTIIRGELINGDETKMHQWAGVYLDEKWFGADPDLDNAEDTNNYFMVGNDNVIGDKTFSEMLVANIKPYEEQKTTFTEPILTNSQYERFKVTVEYSTTETTKEGVVVTISANKEMQPINGWTLSQDKKYMQKEFFSNVEGIVTLTSIGGEKINQEIAINNIDDSIANVNVEYSNNDLDATEVTVSIVSDRELQELEGWTLSEDRKILSKTYYENTTETITIYDMLSNAIPVEIVINNIVNEAPECKVSYSTIDPTNKDVIVTITSNRELKELNGWTLSEDKMSLTKTYNQNTEEKLELEDLYGNKMTALISIKNIDKEKPKLEISYSTKELTNQKVKVEIKSDEKLNKPEGWEISADEKTISKYYFENEIIILKVQDLAGNETEIEVKVENIDKEKPQTRVEYDEKDNQVIVHIISNKELQEVEGWELSEDKKTLTKTYLENEKDVISVIDLAGNITEVAIAVTTINKQTQNNKDNFNGENWAENLGAAITELPFAGKITIVTLIIILVIASIILYLKYRKYNIYSKFIKK